MTPIVLLLTLGTFAPCVSSFARAQEAPNVLSLEPEHEGSVAISPGNPTPAKAKAGDDVSTPLQMKVNNAPAGLDGPHYDWGVDNVRYSPDGKKWQAAGPDNYSSGFPDSDPDQATTQLVNVFNEPGYYKVTVRATATYYGSPDGTVYITSHATLATVQVGTSHEIAVHSVKAPQTVAAPEVRIICDGLDITNQTKSVNVGEKLKLFASLSTGPRSPDPVDPNQSLAAFDWIVADTAKEQSAIQGPIRFASTPSAPNPQPTSGNTVKNQSTVSFTWIDGDLGAASKTVSLQCTYNGKTYTASTIFKVLHRNDKETTTSQPFTADTSTLVDTSTPPAFFILEPPKSQLSDNVDVASTLTTMHPSNISEAKVQPKAQCEIEISLWRKPGAIVEKEKIEKASNTLDSPKLRSNEPIWIQVVLRNTGDVPARFEELERLDDFQIMVRDTNGKEISRTLAAPRKRLPPLLGGSRMFDFVKKGQTMTRYYRVSDFYDMSLGGTYDVTVSRLINEESKATSLPLRINVEPVSPELTPEEESPESSKQP